MASNYVFLSHDPEDALEARKLADVLKQENLKAWPDLENSTPGELWQNQNAKVIRTCRAAAVFIGRKGIGQRGQEISLLLTQAAQRGLRVIPVLLPGAPAVPEPDLSLFLQQFAQVKLPEQGIESIMRGIPRKGTGRRPSKPPAALPAMSAPAQMPAASVSPERKELLDFLERVVGRLLPAALVRSVPEAQRIELKLQELDVEHSGDEILDLFNAREKSLLILGAPGAGKTFMLHRLALALAEVARNDSQARAPIPVILDLARWAECQKPLDKWLVWALRKTFQWKSLPQAWVDDYKILPLLDGLHELRPECRADCIKEIDAYLDDHGFFGMAVCCQSGVCKDLPRLRATVEVQPLTEQQVISYVAATGSAGQSLREMLKDDEGLMRLSQQPEFLLILPEVCKDESGAKALAESAGLPLQDRRQRVFAKYADTRLEESHRYSKESTLRALAWLAQRMQEHSTLFHLGQLQPTWLSTSVERAGYFLASRGLAGVLLLLPLTLLSRSIWLPLAGLAAGAAVGIIDAGLKLKHGVLRALLYAFVTYVPLSLGVEKVGWRAICGPLLALMFGWVLGLRSAEKSFGQDIEIAEELKWSPRWSWEGIARGATAGAIAGLIPGAILVIQDKGEGVLPALLVTGCLALLGALVGSIFGSVQKRTFTRESRPDEELRSALKSAALLFVVFSAGLSLFFYAVVFAFFLAFDQTWEKAEIPSWTPGLLGLLLGLASGLRYSGLDLIQHFVLRALLTLRSRTPAFYVHFLDHASVRGLLRKQVGGYRFYEKPLLDYFASLPSPVPERSAAADKPDAPQIAR